MIRATLALLVLAIIPLAAEAQTSSRRTFTPVPCPVQSWEYADPSLEALPGAQVFAGRYTGGLYTIEIPDNWNAELVLWAHGAVSLSSPQGSRLRVQIPELRQHWIQAGYAWGASSYRCNGSIYGVALLDTMALRDLFVEANRGRAPERVYLAGRSLGGRATILGMQEFPDAFAGGLAMCAAGQETNDLRVAFRAAAELISGIRVSESTIEQDLQRMQEVLGAAPNYTVKGRQLASVQVTMTGGSRPFALEGLALYFINSVGRGTSSAPGATTTVCRIPSSGCKLHLVRGQMIWDRGRKKIR